VSDPLKKFADEAGVLIVDCGPGWGGRYGFKTVDLPNSTVCGFKTKAAARRAWADETFGERAAAALVKLLEKTP